MKKNEDKKNWKEIDWALTCLPFGIVLVLCILFCRMPEKSNAVLIQIRWFLSNQFMKCYLGIGLAFLLISIFISFSGYGSIVLGQQDEKPKYSFFAWGAMMFTCGLAADILFYSFAEWILYAEDRHIAQMGKMEDWVCTFSLFHWGLIPWAFYLVTAVSFGFMLHVRKRERQRFSEACRTLLGKRTDGMIGRFIDLLSVFALLAGTATTFGVATPLMAEIMRRLFHWNLNRFVVTAAILIVTCVIYTYSVLHGIKGIRLLANGCVFLFFGFLLYIFFFGGEARYVMENGLSSFGRMLFRFPQLATYTDPNHTSYFPQNWTVYYWAYWMVWCVAAPFFIGKISKGRSIRQTILGGYGFGMGSTVIGFIIIGNTALAKQISGTIDVLSEYEHTGDIYEGILSMMNAFPYPKLVMAIVLITMIAFYATSFDAIALTAACYSYRKLPSVQNPHKKIQFLWCVLLILFPMALIFSKSSLNSLQSVSIIAAFPLGIVLLLIVISFLIDARKYKKGVKK